MEKTLTARPVPVADVLPFLQRAVTPRTDTTGGMQTVQDMCAHSQAMAVESEGEIVGAYALRPVQHDRGTVIWVMAAGGRMPGTNLTKSVMPVIEFQAAQAGARQVAITTRRNGLAMQLQAMGYEITGITLRKKL